MKSTPQMGLGLDELHLRVAIGSIAPRGALLYDHAGVSLIAGDCVGVMMDLPPASFDLIFADPPYFLSNGGTTCSGGERVAVEKGEWDESRGIGDDHDFHRRWLSQCQRLLKRTGSIWVSGTHHCIFSVGFAAQQLGYHVLNLVTWFKPNASPNLGCRQLTHSTEMLLWAAPKRFDPLEHIFNYDELRSGNDGKQLRDCWDFPVTPQSEKTLGEHPTQKPLALLRRIMKATGRAGGWVLDPFCGSGTTGVAAVERGMNFVGIDNRTDYLNLARARIACMPKGTR